MSESLYCWLSTTSRPEVFADKLLCSILRPVDCSLPPLKAASMGLQLSLPFAAKLVQVLLRAAQLVPSAVCRAEVLPLDAIIGAGEVAHLRRPGVARARQAKPGSGCEPAAACSGALAEQQACD